MLDLGHIKKYVSFPPTNSKVFILISDRSFFISGISGSFPSSLFLFLHFTIAEASVDMIAGMVL